MSQRDGVKVNGRSPWFPFRDGRGSAGPKREARGQELLDSGAASDKASVAGPREPRRAHGPRGLHGFRGARGAVTAEFAVVLPAVLFLLAMLLAGAAAGVTQLRLEGAARAGARELARGEDPGMVTETVRKLAGETAVTAVSSDGSWSTVTVSGRAGGPLGGMVPWTLSATATARTEAAALPWPPAGWFS